MFSYKNTKILFGFVAGLILAGGLTAFAQTNNWQDPPGDPTNCPTSTAGCNTPINVSQWFQEKLGGLTVGGLRSITNIIADERIGIKNSDPQHDIHIGDPNNTDLLHRIRFEFGNPSWEMIAMRGTEGPGGSGPQFRIWETSGDTNLILHNGGVGISIAPNPKNSIESGQPFVRLDTAGPIRVRNLSGEGPVTPGHVLTAIDAIGTTAWQPGGGSGLPTGTASQTLRHNGSAWVANSIITNNGTSVGINGSGTTVPLHIKESRADGPIYLRLENTAAPSSARNWAIFASNGGGFGFHRLGANGYNPLNFAENGQATFARKTTFNQSIRIPSGAQEGYVLTADALGDATWRPSAGGGLPNGTSNQTLRHNGTTWVSNGIIRNDGSKIGIDRDPDTSIFNFKMAVNGGLHANLLWGDDILSTNNSLLSIQSAGRVGIGTTVPEYKLHTIGHSRLNGNVRLGEGNFPDSGSIVGEQSVNVSGGLALLAGGGSINPDGGQIIFHPENSSTGTFWVNDSSNNRFRIFAVSSAPAGTPLPKIGTRAAIITQQVSGLGSGLDGIRVGINQGHNTDLTSTATLSVAGNISASGSITESDYRLKKDIKDLQGGLDIIQKLQGVSYKWKEPVEGLDKTQLGLIAQDVEKILPELVYGDEIKGINYNGLIPVLIEAIKEQQDQIDELKAEIESLK